MFNDNWWLFLLIIILLFGFDGSMDGTETAVLIAIAAALFFTQGGFCSPCCAENEDDLS